MTPDLITDPASKPNQPPSTAGMTTKVVKGSIWTLAGQVAPLFVSLVTTPFVIRLLGTESYGVLVLMILIPSYLSFADLGMNIASTKFSAEAYADGDPDREARIVRTAALIALSSSLPVAVLMIIFAPQIIALFNVPQDLIAEAVLALRIASLTFVISLLNGIFNSPQLARLRMDLNALVTVLPRIAGMIATPLLLYYGFGIVTAVSVLFVAALLTFFGHVFVSQKLGCRLFSHISELSSGRQLFTVGAAMAIAGIAGMVLGNIEKGAISAILSPTSLAYYYVAFTLVNMMTMFSGAMVQSLLPAFAQLQTEHKREQLNSIYSRGIKMNLIWMVPALVALSLIAKDFFTLWAGEDFGRESVTPFYIMLGGIVVNIVAYFPHASLVAAGRTDILAKLYWVEIVPHLLLVWLLTRNFGISGAAAAWALRAIVDALVIFALAKRFAGVRLRLKHLSGFVAAAAVMLVPFAVNLYIQDLTLVTASIAIIALVAYSALVWTRVLDQEEIDWVRTGVYGRYTK